MALINVGIWWIWRWIRVDWCWKSTNFEAFELISVDWGLNCGNLLGLRLQRTKPRGRWRVGSSESFQIPRWMTHWNKSTVERLVPKRARRGRTRWNDGMKKCNDKAEEMMRYCISSSHLRWWMQLFFHVDFTFCSSTVSHAHRPSSHSIFNSHFSPPFFFEFQSLGQPILI